MRLLPRSLHGRMLAISVLATALALVIAGWGIAGVLERFVVAGLDRRLDSEIALLSTAVTRDGGIDRALLDQRVAALEAEPGWRWRIAAPGDTIGSADFPTLAPPRPPAPPPPPSAAPPPVAPDPSGTGPRTVEGASDAGTPIHARALTIATTDGPVVITAAAPRDVVRRPIRAAILPLLLVLAGLGALLGIATIAQLRLGLRPIRALRDQVAAIRRGERDAVAEDQPSELAPLAIELDALTRDNRTALATARLSAANLAHALKTPVAALALDLRDDPPRAAQLARIDATIRHHLARARTQTIDRRETTRIAPALDDLVATIRQLYRAKALAIDLLVDDPDLSVAMDPRDVDELLGNIIDNAAKNARARVAIRAGIDADPRRLAISVSDDGPGIPEQARALVAEPGVRLDEQAEGHGFGLAIARDLVALYGGTLTLGDAAGGGLCVTLALPLAMRSQASPNSSR